MNYRIMHIFRICLLFISLILQSCDNPTIHIQEQQSVNIQSTNILIATKHLLSYGEECLKNTYHQLSIGKTLFCQKFVLEYVDLTGLDLQYADFFGANLKKTDFSRSN